MPDPTYDAQADPKISGAEAQLAEEPISSIAHRNQIVQQQLMVETERPRLSERASALDVDRIAPLIMLNAEEAEAATDDPRQLEEELEQVVEDGAKAHKERQLAAALNQADQDLPDGALEAEVAREAVGDTDTGHALAEIHEFDEARATEQRRLEQGESDGEEPEPELTGDTDDS